MFCAIWPFGKLYTVGLELQDHFAAISYILYGPNTAQARRHQSIIPANILQNLSERRLAQAKLGRTPPKARSVAPGSFDSLFLSRMNAAPEWADLELLLRALAKVHARPLLLSMPMDGRFYDQQGYSRLARENYYEKMRALAQRYNFTLIEFEDHDEDPAFLDSQHTHLTQEGWVFYNRALDDFFHGRVPGS